MEMLVVTSASLFAVFPGAPPATLLGTNKSASIWGTHPEQRPK
jgi:hypothetical protein